ncbi:MAG: DUF1592 domain-containing protein [Planctomycetota bacterium]
MTSYACQLLIHLPDQLARRMTFLGGCWFLALCCGSAAFAEGPQRSRKGLVAFYDFVPGKDPSMVLDRSGIEPPINLKIQDVGSVSWSDRGLEIERPTLIRSESSTRAINVSVRRSNEVTIECWVMPQNRMQKGPARIVSVSSGSSQRNLTLGQEKGQYELRIRTRECNLNGLPSVRAKGLKTQLSHVVAAHDRRGRVIIYIDGDRVVEKQLGRQLGNWSNGYPLLLAGELESKRAWLGTFRMVAIYDRALNSAEVRRNHLAGPSSEFEIASDAASPDRNEEFFATRVAPLLADRCIECHDPANRSGGLDLTRLAEIRKGGDSGPAAIAGQPSESPLWTSVESDDMPHDREPLSEPDKRVIEQWIAKGLAWNVDQIDPADYLHGGEAASEFVRRLTRSEYVETVRRSLGVDLTPKEQALLPRDRRADGFNNTAYNLTVDLEHVESYAKLARLIAGRMDIPTFIDPFTDGDQLTEDNSRSLIQGLGKLVFRGPVDRRELTLYLGLTTTVQAAGGDLREAGSIILQAMLQSPRFLYRVEEQRGGGGTRMADEYELASRISYLVWGSSPDQELVRAAEDGELYATDGIERQVQRLLADPLARKRSRQFVAEWLNLDRLQSLSPAKEHFPDWDPVLAGDMRRETLAYFDEVVWNRDAPLAQLLDADVTFVTRRLARHYRLPETTLAGIDQRLDGKPDDHLTRVDLSDVPERGGLLTQGSVLTIGGDEASTVTRGLFVMHDLLRGVVKDPPPCVDTTPVPTKPGFSMRSIAESRIANASCGGCHSKFEPLAFGLEPFDGLGSFATVDRHGNQLRSDGNLLVPGEAEPREFDTSGELMELLAKNGRVRQSLTWKLVQYALGRPIRAADVSHVKQIHANAEEGGGRYRDLVSAIAASDLVRMTPTEAETEDR